MIPPLFGIGDNVVQMWTNKKGIVRDIPVEINGIFVYPVNFAGQEDIVAEAESSIAFYCKHCGCLESAHAGSKCLFEPTYWERA